MVPPSFSRFHFMRHSISHIRLCRKIQEDSKLDLSILSSLKSFIALQKCTILRAEPAVQQHSYQLVHGTPKQSNSRGITWYQTKASAREEGGMLSVYIFFHSSTENTEYQQCSSPYHRLVIWEIHFWYWAVGQRWCYHWCRISPKQRPCFTLQCWPQSNEQPLYSVMYGSIMWKK